MQTEAFTCGEEDRFVGDGEGGGDGGDGGGAGECSRVAGGELLPSLAGYSAVAGGGELVEGAACFVGADELAQIHDVVPSDLRRFACLPNGFVTFAVVSWADVPLDDYH